MSCILIRRLEYCHDLRGCCVTYMKGFGLDDWIYWHLINSTRNYRQYSAIAILHTLQFTVAHALEFSVFTSRILATDLQLSHSHFKSHMTTSLHRLIPSLPLFCSCQFRRLDSIQFLCSQAHILAGWRLEIRLSLTRLLLLYTAENFFITTLHGQCRKHCLYCWRGVFTAPLPSNRHPIVASVGSRDIVPNCCLVMGLYVTIFMYICTWILSFLWVILNRITSIQILARISLIIWRITSQLKCSFSCWKRNAAEWLLSG
jgi:hypothetical protein